jgi:hypothetical protein
VVAAPDPAGRMEDSMTGGVEGGPGVLPEVPRLQLHLGRVVPGFYDENARRWQSTEIQECSVPSPRSILPAVAARGAGAGRVFWSGGETAKDAAAAFASRTGGTTLEMTSAGRALESSSLPWAEAKPLWQSASGDFAKGAQGNVDVFFSRAARSDSIWTTIERPALQSNPGVTGITVHLTVIP